jgi:hypothetical protein
MLKQARWIAITLLAASALTGIFLRAYLGSFSDAFAFVRGERLLVSPSNIELQPLRPGFIQTVSCNVKNVGLTPIRLIATDTCCECTVTKGLMTHIGSGATQELEFKITSDTQQSEFNKRVVIYTDDLVMPQIAITLTSR